MAGVLIDLRSAFRQLLRQRGLALVALTSLAVGIGASVAITSVTSAVLVRPLPYDHPDELVMVWARSDGPSSLEGFRDPRRLARATLTSGMILQWRERPLPFVDFAVIESWETGVSSRVDLFDGAGVERLRGTLTTTNLFPLLGVRLTRGRTFHAEETGVVVISDRLWRRRFGADPGVIGRTITVAAGREREREQVEIVGVLAERVHFDYPDETEIWLPLTWSAIERSPRMAVSYRAVARLRPELPRETAEAAMQVFRDPAQRNSPRPSRLWLEPVHDYAVGSSRQALVIVFALTLLVLFSGAINAATVFAASTVSRLREMRVRRALGASQRRLARQIFTETAAMAVVAGAAGAATVALALPGLRAILPAGLPRVDEIRLDWLTLAGVSGAVAVSTLLAGAIPAWLSVRDRQRPHLEDTHGATWSRGGLRLRVGLLGVQVTLVTVLLIAGGMLVRSFGNIMRVDKGFEAPRNVYVTEIHVLRPAFARAHVDQFERGLLRRVRELPSVDAASITSVLPFRGTDSVPRLWTADGQMILANRRHVDRDYFGIMRIPLLSGRWFTDADGPKSEPVALVSHTLAQAVYPGVNPLGRDLWGSGARIVGVVGDVRELSLLAPAMPAFYVPRTQATSNRIWLVMRASGEAAPLAADLRRILHEIDPEQPMRPLTTLQQIVDDSVSDRRAHAVIASAFAAVMLLLSALGLCGHLAHAVAERARDLAIRSALGASSTQQLRVLVRHVLPALVAGLVVAMIAVYLAYPLAAPYLFGVDRVDPISWGASVVLVGGCSAAAVLLPARRLARLDAASRLRAV